MTMIERRGFVRRTPVEGEPLARLRMRIGPDLTVLDISDTGALVEAPVRLAPGARLDVHARHATGRVLVRCRVVRSYASLVKATAIRYRAAVEFDRIVDSGSRGLPATH